MSRNDFQDFRNYEKEAEQLISGLSKNQIYELYEIVVQKQKSRQTDTRRKELEAVERVIESKRNLDEGRLRRIKHGYRSQMANDARAKDGNTRPNRKKA